MDQDVIRKLGHDLRGALTTALLVAEHLQSHADPAVARYGAVIGQAIDNATAAVKAATTAPAPAPTAAAAAGQPSWDPSQYLRFGDERLRPALDLLGRIDVASPALVVDLGCGPGNVTPLLGARWPHATLLGVDISPDMLAQARASVPGVAFVAADIATWQPEQAPDVIYSNAALQWLDGHDALLPRLLGLLAPGGVLAVQMPLMDDAPFRTLIQTVAANGPWAADLADVVPLPRLLAPQAYWDLLRPLAASLEMWESVYHHALAGEDAVMQWASGTSLRPYLDALPENQRAAFRQAYAETIRPFYPRRDDGTTLLPFRRLFLVARR